MLIGEEKIIKVISEGVLTIKIRIKRVGNEPALNPRVRILKPDEVKQFPANVYEA